MAAEVVVLTPAPSVSLCVGGLRSELSFATDSDSGRMIVSRAHCTRAKKNQTVAQAVPRKVCVGEESQLLLCQSFVVDDNCGCLAVERETQSRADCGSSGGGGGGSSGSDGGGADAGSICVSLPRNDPKWSGNGSYSLWECWEPVFIV